MVVKQKNSSDCVICCMAMLSGRTYEEILNLAVDYKIRLEQGCIKGVYSKEENEVLAVFGWRCGSMRRKWKVEKDGQNFLETIKGIRAILTVPSLNIEGAYHAIYWDGAEIHDPHNEKTYSKETLPPEASADLYINLLQLEKETPESATGES